MPGRQRGHPSHTSAWVSQAPSNGFNSTITIQSQVSLVISSAVLTQRTLIKHVTPRKAQSYNTVSGSRPSGLEDRPAVRQRQGNPSYSTVRSERHWCTFVYTYHTPPTSKPRPLFEKGVCDFSRGDRFHRRWMICPQASETRKLNGGSHEGTC